MRAALLFNRAAVPLCPTRTRTNTPHPQRWSPRSCLVQVRTRPSRTRTRIQTPTRTHTHTHRPRQAPDAGVGPLAVPGGTVGEGLCPPLRPVVFEAGGVVWRRGNEPRGALIAGEQEAQSGARATPGTPDTHTNTHNTQHSHNTQHTHTQHTQHNTHTTHTQHTRTYTKAAAGGVEKLKSDLGEALRRVRAASTRASGIRQTSSNTHTFTQHTPSTRAAAAECRARAGPPAVAADAQVLRRCWTSTITHTRAGHPSNRNLHTHSHTPRTLLP